MAVTYTNRKKKVYFLHEGRTKKGNPKYYFSMKSAGNLVDEVPDGFEIYENPANAQVFLRRKKTRLVTDDEEKLVQKHLDELKNQRRYIIDIKGDTITIFESAQNINEFKNIVRKLRPFPQGVEDVEFDNIVEDVTNISIHYTPELRFILEDEGNRIFWAERFCYLGSVDDWMTIGSPDSLDKLVETYIPHMGKESFFELF